MADDDDATNASSTDDIEASIVEYFYERQVKGHKCGYCKSEDSFVSNGMWGHRLAGQDYQDLIERGWRRSGKYLYKPIMNRTCCPAYAIRCEALKFKPSRSQRKVANRMRSFLVHGKEPQRAKNTQRDNAVKEEKDAPMEEGGNGASKEQKEGAVKEQEEGENADPTRNMEVKEEAISGEEKNAQDTETEDSLKEKEGDPVAMEVEGEITNEEKTIAGAQEDSNKPEVAIEKMEEEEEENGGSKKPSTSKKKIPRPGVGADPDKPPCRKAKELRLEKKKQKMAAKEAATKKEKKDTKKKEKGASKQTTSKDVAPEEPKSKDNSEKSPALSVEELLKLPLSDDQQKMAHKLDVKIVSCYPLNQEFLSSFIDSFVLYKKYQMAVHGDKEDELSERSYRRFLCDTPLIALDGPKGWECRYGSFHFQYYLDGELIMVAVVDVLPTYLSSVYVFYDPDYAWLDLGVYSALREVELVRKLNRTKPEFQYYCMGYYIHNNTKMNYKGRYSPSYLLCPDTYRFAPLELARARLDKEKYSRLNDEPYEAERVLSFLGGVLILFEKQVIPYMLFRSYYGHVKDRIVMEYASLVGKAVTQRMFLYLLLDGAKPEEDNNDQ